MKSKTPLFLLATFLLAVPACLSFSDTASYGSRNVPLPTDPLILDCEGRVGGRLNYALSGEPSHFNFAAAADTRSKLIAYLTTGTLLEFDPVEKTVTAGVCKKWRVSADGRKVFLILREGVKFSDGSPLSARDVVFTFEKIYEEGSKNALKDALLINGKPIAVSATDSHRLELTFPESYAAAEYILTSVPVLPSHLLQDPDKKIEEYWTLDASPATMAGLGPFVLSHHDPGEKTIISFNPHYWKVDRAGVRLPYLDELVFHYVEDRDNQLLRFQAAQLDLIDYLLRPGDALHLRSTAVRLQDAGPSNRLTLLWFNLNTARDAEEQEGKNAATKMWFGKREFRQAVDAAISRRTIVRNIYLGHAEPAYSLVPPSLKRWYFSQRMDHLDDPDLARRLLSTAGFRWRRTAERKMLVDSKGRPVQFEIATRSDEVLGKTAAIIQQDLEKLGMKVQVRQEEFRTLISRIMASRDYDAALLSIEVPVEPADHLNLLLSSGALHMWNPNQAQPATEWERRIDELARTQALTLEPQVRQRLYQEIQGILAEEVPFIPLVHPKILIASRPVLHNLKPASLFPYGLWNAYELWLEED